MRDADIDCLGREGIKSVRIEESEEINKSEVPRALKKMKCGELTSLDRITSESLKKRRDCIVKWLVKLFNVYLENFW